MVVATLLSILLNIDSFGAGAMKKKSSSPYTRCELVEKPFINKRGKVSKHSELYLRCSIQDYFIKICESEVSRDDLKPYIGKGIEVLMDVREGSLDLCPEDPPEAQSRVGTYVVIKKIISS